MLQLTASDGGTLLYRMSPEKYAAEHHQSRLSNSESLISVACLSFGMQVVAWTFFRQAPLAPSPTLPVLPSSAAIELGSRIIFRSSSAAPRLRPVGRKAVVWIRDAHCALLCKCRQVVRSCATSATIRLRLECVMEAAKDQRVSWLVESLNAPFYAMA